MLVAAGKEISAEEEEDVWLQPSSTVSAWTVVVEHAGVECLGRWEKFVLFMYVVRICRLMVRRLLRLGFRV